MSIQYTLIFFVLVIEVAIFLLLIFPLPRAIKQTILGAIVGSKKTEQIMKYFLVFLLFVGFFFYDSYTAANRLQAEIEQVKSQTGVNISALDEKYKLKFLFERNIYICASTIFMIIALNRYIAILRLKYKKSEEYKTLLKSSTVVEQKGSEIKTPVPKESYESDEQKQSQLKKDD